jgi:hypothetical protein
LPDWISHILVVLIILKFVKTEHKGLLAIAAILPDIDHVLMLFGLAYGPGMAFLTGGRFLHNIVGVLTLALVVSSIRPKALYPLFGVAVIHITMDALIGSYGTPLLFPFYTGNMGYPLLSNYTPWIPIILSIVYVSVSIFYQPGLWKYRIWKRKHP